MPSWLSALVGVAQLWQSWAVLGALVTAIGFSWPVFRWVRHQQRKDLILLREVYVHMIQTRPVDPSDQHHIQRLSDNFDWWELEIVKRLTRAGASDGEISRFKALGNLSKGNVIADKLDQLDRIIARLEGHRS